MKRRPSLLQRIWRKLRKPRPAAAPARRVPERKPVSSLEPLEGRISPAALINPTTLMFKDVDGDIVTVKFTKSLFTSPTSGTNLASANLVFKFNTGTVDSTAFSATTAPAQQLQLVDITSKGAAASGTGITISVVKAGGGNGMADVGYIKATGLPLGAVTVNGDLGQIDAGVASSPIGLASLKVKSLGARPVAETQQAGGELKSSIVGSVNSVTVTGDVNGASFIVANAGTTPGKIGSVNVGGSLKGGAAADSGLISATWDIGLVKVGTKLTDGIVGGAGSNSGRVISDGKIGSIVVSGDIAGAGGSASGSIHARGSIGPVLVKGSVLGGAGKDSGSISGSGIGTVTIGGSLKAGSDDTGSGVISSLRSIGLVKITGDLDGSNAGATADSIGVGGIRAAEKIAGVTILGSLKGGAKANSGFIDAGSDLGPVSVKEIVGGAGQGAGTISAGGKIAGVLVKTDVTGGAGGSSGSIFSGTDPNFIGDMGVVKIGGKLIGDGGDNSGAIISGGKIASVTIGPAAPSSVAQVKGGAGDFSGSVVAFGAIPTVRVTGNVEGGGGSGSGSIISYDSVTPVSERAGDLGVVTITGDLKGGGSDDTGVIWADGKIGTVTTGDLIGAGGNRSGSIRAGQGSINSGTGLITVKGDMIKGSGAQTGGIISEGKILGVFVTGKVDGGTIRAGDNIGSIVVNSDVMGGAQFSARGMAVQGATTDLAIGRISILGDVANSRIRAGYDTSLTNAVNPDAQIGAVFVKGDWIESSLFAGVSDGGDNQFGNANDVKIAGTDNAAIVSQIASIVIGGNVVGTAAGGDSYGFVAQKIGALRVGLTVFPFTAAGLEVKNLLASTTNDVTAREVAI